MAISEPQDDTSDNKKHTRCSPWTHYAIRRHNVKFGSLKASVRLGASCGCSITCGLLVAYHMVNASRRAFTKESHPQARLRVPSAKKKERRASRPQQPSSPSTTHTSKPTTEDRPFIALHYPHQQTNRPGASPRTKKPLLECNKKPTKRKQRHQHQRHMTSQPKRHRQTHTPTGRAVYIILYTRSRAKCKRDFQSATRGTTTNTTP